MKILVMTDLLYLPTGMGRVGRELAHGLHRRGHEIVYLGWFAGVDGTAPFKVYKTLNQHYGADVFDRIVQQERPDVVLTIGDAWMIKYISEPDRCKTRSLFQWVGYLPIDGHTINNGIPPTWHSVFRDMDYKIAYTEYGKKVILESLPELADEIRVIPHGVDTNVYKPLPAEEVKGLRKKIHLSTDKINFLMVARNQFRKNIPEVTKIWNIFKKAGGGRHDNAVFWPHMNFNDSMGWNLDEIFDINFGANPEERLKSGLQFFDKIAHGENNLKLMPEEHLNWLYNCCDVFILIAGEGFGLPIVEAMACGKPVIVLDHSACGELARGRGELVKIASSQFKFEGENFDVNNTMSGKYSTERPSPDVESLLKAIDRLYHSHELREKYGKAAYDFIHKGVPGMFHGRPLTWDSACDMFHDLMEDIYHPLRKPVKLREVA